MAPATSRVPDAARSRTSRSRRRPRCLHGSGRRCVRPAASDRPADPAKRRPRRGCGPGVAPRRVAAHPRRSRPRPLRCLAPSAARHACYREARRVKQREVMEIQITAPDAGGTRGRPASDRDPRPVGARLPSPDDRAARGPCRPPLRRAARCRGSHRPRHRRRDFQVAIEPSQCSPSSRPRGRRTHTHHHQGVHGMTGHDDFDRTLADWFRGDALSPTPAGDLDRVLAATGRRSPDRRGSRVSEATGLALPPGPARSPAYASMPGLGLRWSTALIVLLVIAALVGGAIMVGARWFQAFARTDRSARSSRLWP